MMRAVLDTNVIVSSFLRVSNTPAKIRDSWRAGHFQLCTSNPLMAELDGVLRRPKIVKSLEVSPAEISEFLERVQRKAEFPASPLDVKPVIANDPADDIVLATALAAAADFIVTGDSHLLSLETYEGIPIVSPRRFLSMLEKELND